MKLLTLIEIELKKLLPVLLIILGLMLAASTFLFYQFSTSFNRELTRELTGISVAEYITLNGPITLAQIKNLSFNLINVLYGFTAVLLVSISSFYLWYKEWFGQSKRIYMLLSLRGSRYTILLSKLITVLFASFIFYGAILLSLVLGGLVTRFVLPTGIFEFTPISSVLAQSTSFGLGFSLPLTFVDFIYKLFFVTVAFSGISVWVLSDRSKKIWGFIFGGAYCILIASIYIRTLTVFLFFDERFIVDWGFVLGASALNLALSYVLLNKKISI